MKKLMLAGLALALLSTGAVAADYYRPGDPVPFWYHYPSDDAEVAVRTRITSITGVNTRRAVMTVDGSCSLLVRPSIDDERDKGYLERCADPSQTRNLLGVATAVCPTGLMSTLSGSEVRFFGLVRGEMYFGEITLRGDTRLSRPRQAAAMEQFKAMCPAEFARVEAYASPR